MNHKSDASTSGSGWLTPGWSFSLIPVEALMGAYSLSPAGYRMLGYLAWRAGGTGTAWPGIRRIAADLKLSEGAVRKHLKELREKGWLVVHERFDPETGAQLSNAYALRNPGGGKKKSLEPPYTPVQPPPSTPVDPNDKYKNDIYTANELAEKGETDVSLSPDSQRSENSSPHEHGEQEKTDQREQKKVPVTLSEWLDLLQKSRNRVALLRWMLMTLFPDHDPPPFSWVGRVARDVGGAASLAKLLWEVALYSPDGDVLLFAREMYRKRQRRHNGKWTVSKPIGEGEIDYSQFVIADPEGDAEVEPIDYSKFVITG